MQKIFLIFLMLCASPAFPQGDSDHPGHIKYTKYQRKVAGFWRGVMEADDESGAEDCKSDCLKKWGPRTSFRLLHMVVRRLNSVLFPKSF
jgi:hypothetical protein